MLGWGEGSRGGFLSVKALLKASGQVSSFIGKLFDSSLKEFPKLALQKSNACCHIWD